MCGVPSVTVGQGGSAHRPSGCPAVQHGAVELEVEYSDEMKGKVKWKDSFSCDFCGLCSCC